MTCIVGIIEKDTIYIGGDSAATGASEITIRKDPKVFSNGEFLIGVAGSFRTMQVLRFSFKPPKQKKTQDQFGYMCTDFINEMRNCLREAGVMFIKDELQEHESVMLVGYKNKLYIIDSDFQVGEHIEPWNSCGSGAPYALGALKATSNINLTARERIIKALEAASHYNITVSAPYTIKTLKFKPQ